MRVSLPFSRCPWTLYTHSFALQVPIPEHMDLYHLHQEADPSDRTALESVVVRCGPAAGYPLMLSSNSPTSLRVPCIATSLMSRLAYIARLRHVALLTCACLWQDHINEEIARLNALEERIMNESGPDDERLQARPSFRILGHGFMRGYTAMDPLSRHCGTCQHHS